MSPLTRQIPFWLTLAMGTCTEATIEKERVDVFDLPFENVTKYGYIEQNSELCDGVWFSGAQIVSYWLDVIVFLVLLAFVTREFYKTKQRATKFDKNNTTTSDFAVLLEGLDRAVEVDDKEKGLSKKLEGDLEQMGFKLGEEVYSIEMACVCKKAKEKMSKLAKLHTERQELQAVRKAHHHEKNGASTRRIKGLAAWMTAALEDQQLQEEIHDAELRVVNLVNAPQMSTGHAFIIFNEELKRNEFIKRIKKPSFSERILFSVMKCLGGNRIVKLEKACHLHKLADRTEKFYSSHLERSTQKRLPHFESCKDVNQLKVEVAPEPSDIFWENLEMTKESRLRWNVLNFTILTVLTVFSFFLLVSVSVAADAFKQQVQQTYEDSVVVTAQTTAYGFAASSVTVVTNALTSVISVQLSKKAGPTSQTGFQRSIFTMLATFYLINTSITPFFAQTLQSYRSGHMNLNGRNIEGSATSTGQSNVIYQNWYDSGGVVNSMLFTLLSSTVSFVVSQMFPVKAVFKRHVLSLRATSQHKLNDLYEPPEMHVGKNYAKLVKVVSLVIIYGPLYPLLYLVAVGYLFVSFYASRFGIAHWFARPSFMTERVAERMCGWLAISVGISLVFKRFAMSNAGADTPLILSAIVWIGYMVVYEVRRCAAAPLARACVLPSAQPPPWLTRRASLLTTDASVRRGSCLLGRPSLSLQQPPAPLPPPHSSSSTPSQATPTWTRWTRRARSSRTRLASTRRSLRRMCARSCTAMWRGILTTFPTTCPTT